MLQDETKSKTYQHAEEESSPGPHDYDWYYRAGALSASQIIMQALFSDLVVYSI